MRVDAPLQGCVRLASPAGREAPSSAVPTEETGSHRGSRSPVRYIVQQDVYRSDGPGYLSLGVLAQSL